MHFLVGSFMNLTGIVWVGFTLSNSCHGGLIW